MSPSPSLYRFLEVDVNMCFIMVDIGTVESISVMFFLSCSTRNGKQFFRITKKKNLGGAPNFVAFEL